jgi:hypothetical protein
MAFGLSFILGPWTQILIMLYAPYQSFKVVPLISLYFLNHDVVTPPPSG